ncbi:mannan polymerase ii complex anp1 subunit [Diplodia corticola]|uniref:Mannan polymerase ii complex anp1 subunit n=1 Tax=Diplodia corticola TaxID=236234 RepID=A0A1J9R7L8_9PEZI|nr:mannan polymerase ii complex anp1 subunit [Diplodia corticola]OJD36513.1 mannan polymerase ii complex anp1 subunit [Diplodia corticola]
MHRHGFANGYAGYSTGGQQTFHIEPHKFQPRSTPAQRRRRSLFIRIGLLSAVVVTSLFLFSSGFRAAVGPVLTLGLFSASPDFQLETVRYYDLNNVQGTARGWEREERILLCAPLRDAAPHLPMFFGHLRNLTYPHNFIDLAFLVGDSKDNTLELLSELLEGLQANEDPTQHFGEISIMEKDFGQKVNQDVESRHGFAAQAGRRKSMAQARNWLLSAALRPTHSWVYWRDVDVETAPFTILEDLMRHNKDIIVPNVWRPLPDWLGGEQPYDLNSWQESETALALADTLDEDAVIVEGYAEYATWRPHLAYLRDPYGDPDMEMEIDGVGGVSILAKAKVFRSGVHFPAFSFEKHAETEGFGKMAKRMKYSVVGLPHYTIWHLYEPSVDDIRHMEEMEQERLAKAQETQEKEDRLKKLKDTFETPSDQWRKDKADIRKIAKEEYMENEKDGKTSNSDQTDSKAQTSKDDSAKGSSGKDSSGKDSSVKDSSVKDSSVKDSSVKDNSAKDSSAKDSSAKDSSAKDTLAKDSLAKDNLAKDSSAKEQTSNKDHAESSKAKAEQVKEEQSKKNQNAVERAKAAHAKFEAEKKEAEEKSDRDQVTGEKKAEAPLVKDDGKDSAKQIKDPLE